MPPKASISQPGSTVAVHPTTMVIATTSPSSSWPTASSIFSAFLFKDLSAFIELLLSWCYVVINKSRVAHHYLSVNFDAEIHPIPHEITVVIGRMRRIVILHIAFVVAAARTQISDMTGVTTC